jgi:predicted RNase H-like HicB family nuclease
VSTGKTLEEVKINIAEAIEMHIDSLRVHGDPVPPPAAQVAVIEVAL